MELTDYHWTKAGTQFTSGTYQVRYAKQTMQRLERRIALLEKDIKDLRETGSPTSREDQYRMYMLRYRLNLAQKDRDKFRSLMQKDNGRKRLPGILKRFDKR